MQRYVNRYACIVDDMLWGPSNETSLYNQYEIVMLELLKAVFALYTSELHIELLC